MNPHSLGRHISDDFANSLPTKASLKSYSWSRRFATHSASSGAEIDQTKIPPTVDRVKLRHLRTKLSRLDMSDAAREATALKAQFRRDDEELYRQGRGAEVLADRMKNLGMGETGRTRLITVNGVRINP